MITFLIILCVWLIPAWFSIRLNLIAHGHRLDALDIFMIFFFVPAISYFGLAICVAFAEGDEVRRTFFIPPKKRRSLERKMFWYKVQTYIFNLFLVRKGEL